MAYKVSVSVMNTNMIETIKNMGINAKDNHLITFHLF